MDETSQPPTQVPRSAPAEPDVPRARRAPAAPSGPAVAARTARTAAAPIVPRRLRRVFRGAFLLLLAASLGLALDVLHDEKKRSHRAYAVGLRKSEAQIAARLRHPTGQLMLLNAAAADLPATPLVPLVLPFGAIDFDDRAKALQAVELAGCGVVYGDGASLCAGIGSNPFAGAFVYVVGQIPTAALVPHRAGQLDFGAAHRAWVEIRLAGGESWRWIAPYQAQAGEALSTAPAGNGAGAQRGRLVAFDADAEVSGESRPLRDVRGWMWQEGDCLDGRDAAGAVSRAASGAAPSAMVGAPSPAPSSLLMPRTGEGSSPSLPAEPALPGAPPVPAAAAQASSAASLPSAASGAPADAGALPVVGPVGLPHATVVPTSAPSIAGAAGGETDCLRRTYISLRLPVPAWRDALAAGGAAAWPPAQLAGTQVRLQFLGPGEGNVLFDSDNPGRGGTAAASAPFALAEFRRLLLPGETLRVQREGHEGVVLEAHGADPVRVDPAQGTPDAAAHGAGERGTPAAPGTAGAGAEADDLPLPWIDELIRWLPVPGYDAPIEQRSIIATRLGNYRLTLVGDLRSVNRQLAAVATRLAGYVAAMLGAVLTVWLLLEVVVIRRIAQLTRRAAAASGSMRAASASAPGDRLQRLDAALELDDLAGRDELGVLAQGLRDLLGRVNADVERERIRVRQERDQWHAVGHEIVSPLQSLMALHGDAADPASRYLHRMQQAVRVLYGQASPSEAFESTQLTLQTLDVDAFAAMVAGNAPHIGIEQVTYRGPGAPAWVLADEHSLEDVLTHVLRNAERHREPGTPITLVLGAAGDLGPADGGAATWQLVVHNRGRAIPEAMLERIFEYGVSAEPANAAEADGRIEPSLHAEEPSAARRGQGLFVARTYMAKMGGTIRARNAPDGVEFVLSLPGAARPEAPARR